MGDKTTNVGNKDHHTSHKWVHYSNPRNGRIQVSACQHCGTMLAGILASKPCIPTHAKNPIEAKGWIISSQAPENQAQRIKIGT